MKKSLQKIAVVTLLAAVPLMGGGFVSTTESLFALEGGHTQLNADVDQSSYDVQKGAMGHFGLKLGAQGKHYRVFLSGRNFVAEKGNTIVTMGGEIQYKFNFSKPVSFFMGANGGAANIKIGASGDGALPSVSTTVPYFGGDVGFNYNASDIVDLELGVKYMRMGQSVTQEATSYNFSNLTSGYGSVIIKWQMD